MAHVPLPRPSLDLSRRAQPQDLPELMDQPCTRAELRACLRDVAWLNRTLFGYRPILHWLDSVGSAAETTNPLRILDVGSGYGDTLRRIAEWARAKSIAVELTGLDLNPDATAIAAQATPKATRIHWVTGDVFAYAPATPPHLVLSSLFTHHLSDDEVIRFLQWMEKHALTGWCINDLSRNIVPYRLLYRFTRLMRLHPFVKHDGPVSIARAFVPRDWQRYTAAAGLSAQDVVIRGFSPGRLRVTRRKPS